MNLILQAIKSMFRKVNMMFNQLSNNVEIAQTNAVEAKALAEKQSDWNQNDETAPDYIKNRTHYDTRESQEIEIAFDGNIEGKEIIELEEGFLYAVKISDETYPSDAFINGTIVFYENGEEFTDTINENGFNYISDDVYGIGNGNTMVVLNDITIDDISLTKGIWTTYAINEIEDPLFYTKSISGKITNGILKKIEKKFLPDDIGVTPDWNQLDETAPDYIKNKPFGDIGEIHLLAENKLPDHDSSYCGLPYHKFESDASYYIRIDGVNYQCFIRDGYNTLDFYHSDETRIGALFSPEDDPTSLELNLNYSYFSITIPHTFELIEVKCQKIDRKFLHTPDWSQNDENAPDYIKNKPFYDIETREVLVEETTFNVVNGSAEYAIRFNDHPNSHLNLGQTLTITFDGVEYESVMTIDSDACYWINFDTSNGHVEIYDFHTVYFNNDGNHTIKIEKVSGTLKKVDGKFLYNADWNQNDETAPDYVKNRTHWKQAVDGPIVDTDLDFTTENIVNFSQEDANRIFNMRQDVVYQVMINDTIVYQNSIVFDEKGLGILLDKFLPIDTAYGFILLISPKDNIVRLSHNKIKGTEYAGVYHFTLKVVGDYIYNPIDSNYLPAALGHSTSAEGWAFHRHGENEALGRDSVAGGYHTKATGTDSFAFGYWTEASGAYSTASGAGTKANGESSVAVGLYTTANGRSQTTLGRFNLIDETAPTSVSYGKYAHIIGNGANEDSRSNAYTLDWEGNGWFAGGLKVGGVGQDDSNAQEVALKSDVEEIVQNALNNSDINSNAIIDVAELPTENINENVFYRLQSAELVGKNTYMFHLRVVNTLPESGVYLDTSISKTPIYYNLSDGNAYVYADQTAINHALFESIGWYSVEHLYEKFSIVSWGGIITNINEAYKDEVTHHLFLSHSIWLHKDGQWIPVTSACREGEGEKSVIFNDLSNSASGISSHAQGFGAHAQGKYSHAEGHQSYAQGDNSHSEGYKTHSEAYGSHAEGCETYSQGNYSHTEGYKTYAQSWHSHAEGRGTIAACANQHAQGQYNIIDPGFIEINNDTLGKYAHIIGNGTADDARSNAHTLDWNGLGWFAGGLKVGGTGQDDEAAVEVATKNDIPNGMMVFTGEWDATKSYSGGSVVLYNNILYMYSDLTTPSTVGTTPNTEGSNWLALFSASIANVELEEV